MIEEIRKAGEAPVPYTLGYAFERFDALIARLEQDEKGVDLPENFVPNSTFWLVRDGVEIVGASNLRHRLTPNLSLRGGHIGFGVRPSARKMGYGRKILKHTLPAARNLGLSKVLITCGKTNVASAKIIVACGGVFDSEEFIPADDEIVQRYWISF